jgi:hypothetical protein
VAAGATLRAVTDRRGPDPLPPPADPWAGAAEVFPRTTVMPAEPYVIVVDRPRRRRWPWIAGIAAIGGVLCCIGAAAVWAPISREYPAHLELGSEVAGFTHAGTQEYRAAEVELENQIYRDYGVDSAKAAVLTSSAKDGRTIILISATKLILNPADEPDKAIRGVAGRHELRDVKLYAELAGHVTCGNSEDDKKQPIVVCAWTDHGSLGVGIFYGTWTMDGCASTLGDIRAAIVRRGT